SRCDVPSVPGGCRRGSCLAVVDGAERRVGRDQLGAGGDVDTKDAAGGRFDLDLRFFRLDRANRLAARDPVAGRARPARHGDRLDEPEARYDDWVLHRGFRLPAAGWPTTWRAAATISSVAGTTARSSTGAN